MKNYIKGKGIFAGTFTEDDIESGVDTIAVQNIKDKTGLSYTNTELVRDGNTITGISIYICAVDDFTI